MKTDKLAINRQNFARVRLQLKFTFIIRPLMILNTKQESCQSFKSVQSKSATLVALLWQSLHLATSTCTGCSN